MITCVLDLSALVALLRVEPGAEVVAAHLVGSAISVVNLSEVVALFARAGAGQSQISGIIDPLPVARLPMDEGLAYAAGMLQPMTRSAGLSLGDRVCLALARQLQVPAVTGDHEWQGVAAAVGARVLLIR